MSEQDWIVKFIMPGMVQAQKETGEEQETFKHLPGKHNQKRHGWRYSGDKLSNARRAMRGQTAEERAEYRKRAGMPEPKKIEKPKVEKKVAIGEPRHLPDPIETRILSFSNGTKLLVTDNDLLQKKLELQLSNYKTYYRSKDGSIYTGFNVNKIKDSDTRNILNVLQYAATNPMRLSDILDNKLDYSSLAILGLKNRAQDWLSDTFPIMVKQIIKGSRKREDYPFVNEVLGKIEAGILQLEFIDWMNRVREW